MEIAPGSDDGCLAFVVQHEFSLIQAKLLKNIHGTSRARKRAWARNKPKVHKLQNELKELRASLTTAMGASSLLVCCCCFDFIDADNSSSSSAIRAETALDSMNHCLTNSEQISLSLDKHLLSIQQIITQTYDAVSAQGVAMNRLLQSHVSQLNRHSNPIVQQSAGPLRHSGKQHVFSRLCSYHNREHITHKSLVSPTGDQEDSRESKSAIISSTHSHLHKLRRNSYPGTLESLRSFTDYFSRIIHYVSATASIVSHRAQLLRVDLFCCVQNQFLLCFLPKITKTVVHAKHNYSSS